MKRGTPGFFGVPLFMRRAMAEDLGGGRRRRPTVPATPRPRIWDQVAAGDRRFPPLPGRGFGTRSPQATDGSRHPQAEDLGPGRRRRPTVPATPRPRIWDQVAAGDRRFPPARPGFGRLPPPGWLNFRRRLRRLQQIPTTSAGSHHDQPDVDVTSRHPGRV